MPYQPTTSFTITQEQVRHFFIEDGLKKAAADPKQKGSPGFLLDPAARVLVNPAPIHTAESFDNAHGTLDAAPKDQIEKQAAKAENKKKKSALPTTSGRETMGPNEAAPVAGSKDEAKPAADKQPTSPSIFASCFGK